MLVDATNTSAQLVGQTQNVDQAGKSKDNNHQNEINRPGQSSDAGPAVVTSFSAAALESSRAVSEAGQTVDNSKTAPEEQASRQELSGEAESTIDVFV